MDDTHPDHDPVLLGLVMTTCILSMIGASLIIFSYFRWRDLQTNSRQLLVYLSIADFLTAGGNLMGMLFSHSNSASCKAQSFITTYSSLVSFHWTVYIAWYLYLCMPGITAKPNRALPFFHFGAWIVPLVIVSVAMALDVLGGYSWELWCWINGDLTPDQLILWYACALLFLTSFSSSSFSCSNFFLFPSFDV